MKFDFGNKLANYDLYTGIIANCVFGLITAIFIKWKGLYLTVSVIGIFIIIQRVAGLCQPFISKIKIESIIIITIIFDSIWSFNLIMFCVFQYNFSTFLILNMIINVFCKIGFTSIGFGINKIVAEKINFQEYQMWQHTYSNAANLSSSFIAIGLIYCFNEFFVMIIAAIMNLSYQLLAWKVRKELKKEIKWN